MGVINSVAMLMPRASEVGPGALGWILGFLNGILGNAAWTMIVFTIIIKLLTFPLDYYSRYKMRKNAFIMEEMKEKLERLEKQCKGDKRRYQQQSMPMLKKEGYSIGGACLPMVITLGLFIFILFAGLNPYATYKNVENFNAMANLYESTVGLNENHADDAAVLDGLTDLYRAEKDENDLKPLEERNVKYQLSAEAYRVSLKGLNPKYEEDKKLIDAALVAEYEKLNPSWLWIQNPWRPDVPYTDGFFKFMASVKPIPSLDEFKNGKYGVGKINFTGDDIYELEENYLRIMQPVIDAKSVKRAGNGMYFLIVLAAVSSFASQFIIQKTQKQAMQPGQMGQMGSSMKIMTYVFPLMLVIFAIAYSSVFTLYIITNSLFTLGSTLLINFFVGKRMEKLKLERISKATPWRRMK